VKRFRRLISYPRTIPLESFRFFRTAVYVFLRRTKDKSYELTNRLIGYLGQLAQLEEHSVYTRKVVGSSPALPILPNKSRQSDNRELRPGHLLAAIGQVLIFESR
jgi:hypothetical protein